MYKTKLITADGTPVSFETDDPLDFSTITGDTKRLIYHFKNKICVINLERISFMETEK